MLTPPLLLLLATLLSFSHAENTNITSSTGSCGPLTSLSCLTSQFGSCCSASSFCGSNATYCGSGCQPDFGACYPDSTQISPADVGTCGATSTGNYTCLGSVFGNCCSGNGFCGGGDTYCGSASGCQSGYGVCGSKAADASVATTVLATATAAATSSAQDGSGGLSSGAKAGIAIAVVVIALAIIGAIAFFVLKRRRGHQRMGNEAAPPYERGVEMPAASAQEKQYDGKPIEMSSESAGGNVVELPTRMSAAELPAGGMSEKERIARMDERVAAGYDGAYRGN